MICSREGRLRRISSASSRAMDSMFFADSKQASLSGPSVHLVNLCDPPILARLGLRPTNQDPLPGSLRSPPSPQGQGKKFRNFIPLPRGEGGRRRRPGERSLACDVAKKLDSRSQVPYLRSSSVAHPLLETRVFNPNRLMRRGYVSC